MSEHLYLSKLRFKRASYNYQNSLKNGLHLPIKLFVYFKSSQKYIAYSLHQKLVNSTIMRFHD